MRRAKRIFSYRQDGRRAYRVDMGVRQFDGTRSRYREWGFRNLTEAEQAVDHKLSLRFLPPKENDESLTVREAWRFYEDGSISMGRPSSSGRFKHLNRHLGGMRVVDLHPGVVDAFRMKRRLEPLTIAKRDPQTDEIKELPRLRNGSPRFPSDCQLDHEVKLLRSVVGYAVRCKRIRSNPLVGMRLLNPDNVRTSAITETEFQRLLNAADPWLRPMLIISFDTGMRRGEIVNLNWERINLKEGSVLLRADDTKARRARLICLTDRARAALQELGPTVSGPVFVKLPAGKRRLSRGTGLRNGFDRAKQKAGLGHLWFHDLRRSFVTNARKRGVPESVVMKMSGHQTRGVFARYNIVDDGDLREAVKRIEAGQTA